jgi:hypothetical protein
VAGKGDRMRRVDGTKYRDNYDQIVWSNPEPTIGLPPEQLKDFWKMEVIDEPKDK